MRLGVPTASPITAFANDCGLGFVTTGIGHQSDSERVQATIKTQVTEKAMNARSAAPFCPHADIPRRLPDGGSDPSTGPLGTSRWAPENLPDAQGRLPKSIRKRNGADSIESMQKRDRMTRLLENGAIGKFDLIRN
jgi:hypothetical protein